MSDDQATVGVLVMAHGTPPTLEDVPAFYTEIRRGRPPTPDLLEDLLRRYRAIGGTSPLNQRARAHATALDAALAARAPGRYVVELGSKFASPRIEDGVGALARRGVRRVVGLALAPHFSPMSVGQYAARAEQAGASLRPPVAVRTVEHWHLAPGLVPLLADRVAAALRALPPAARADALVCFTAHSLPARVVAEGDPYPEQVRQSADAVASAAGLRRYGVAFQSAGRTPEPWLGPDILQVVAEAPSTGATGVVVCPVGFVSDHLEVLYDLDIEAADVARRAGVPFARTASLDGDPDVAAVLAQVVLATDAG